MYAMNSYGILEEDREPVMREMGGKVTNHDP